MIFILWNKHLKLLLKFSEEHPTILCCSISEKKKKAEKIASSYELH